MKANGYAGVKEFTSVLDMLTDKLKDSAQMAMKEARSSTKDFTVWQIEDSFKISAVDKLKITNNVIIKLFEFAKSIDENKHKKFISKAELHQISVKLKN